MDFRTRTLNELQNRRSHLAGKSALVGLDGFVDRIVSAVDQRQGQGDAFTPIPTIESFGRRVLAAAGKSTNIELYPRLEKLGGNGPIMANALLAAGSKVRYIGALGKPAIHPVLAEFAEKTQAVSLSEPGITTALEFQDGKLMLGTMVGLDDVTYDAVIAALGEGPFNDLLSRMDLIALVNWTMIPNMTAFLAALLEKVFPILPPPRDKRYFFFDLADPEKRSKGDLTSALRTMARFQNHGHVTIGFNLKEAQEVTEALGLDSIDPTESGLKKAAAQLRQELSVGTVVVHPRESAACATRDNTWWVPGPYCERPLITTGAGDHFNAGFVSGQLMGLSPEACLATGVSFSGHYVRSGRSPSLADVDSLLRNWPADGK